MNNCIELSLPFPPSINTYWGFRGHRRFLTKKANEFKELVASAVKQQTHPKGSFGVALLSVSLEFYPPDRRIRDIDNPVKPLLDSLVAAGLFDDDSQIKELYIRMNNPLQTGFDTPLKHGLKVGKNKGLTRVKITLL
jgi:crossover junction endodeoxyribonuclease RusA